MALNIRDIKRRQKSVKNIGQMARAMELVSVTKMRKSQRVALASRPYSRAALKILRNISQKMDASKSYFFGNVQTWTCDVQVKKTAILLITTDKGLCAGLNTNVFRKAEKLISGFIKNTGSATSCEDFIVIGKKGEEWCRRKNFNVIKSFNNFGDYVEVSEITSVSEFLINIFRGGEYTQIFAVYTNFISALKQEAVSRKILPLNEKELNEIIDSIVPAYGKFSDSDFQVSSFNSASAKATADKQVSSFDFEYKFEPKAEEVLDEVLYSLVETEIYYIILENNASEHSARRMAMRNAYENADEMLSDLTLTYNKARQAGITQELSEIAAGANVNN